MSWTTPLIILVVGAAAFYFIARDDLLPSVLSLLR